MTRRVALIVERADIALGGAERSMAEVASALRDNGWRADLLAAKGTAQSDTVHVLCSEIPGKRVSLGVFGRALKQHLSRNHYDIVHSVLPFDFANVYQPRGGTYAETLLRNAASYRSPLERWWKRATAFTNRRRAQRLYAERSLCQGPDGPLVAALSNYVVEQLVSHYGTPRQRIVLNLNGVNTEHETDPQTTDRVRSEIYEKLRLADTDTPLLLLFAAHNFRLKGLDRLIQALPRAVAASMERMPNLIILGAGRADPYRRLAEKLGVAQHVLFLGADRNVRDALSVCDVGVLPTFYDPASRFILEALAAGKPVITTRFNGAADQFVDGRHGIVLDSPEDIDALSQAMLQFSATENVTKAVEAIKCDDLRSKVSIARVARELCQLYESILEKRPSS